VSTVVYRVYVLRNPVGKFYIGLSEDPATRLIQHNQGVSHWTKNRGPWELVWQSESMDLSSARKLENLLKRQKGGRGFFQITGLSRTSGS
jgi:putative endonuclease